MASEIRFRAGAEKRSLIEPVSAALASEIGFRARAEKRSLIEHARRNRGTAVRIRGIEDARCAI